MIKVQVGDDGWLNIAKIDNDDEENLYCGPESSFTYHDLIYLLTCLDYHEIELIEEEDNLNVDSIDYDQLTREDNKL
jgi:hypothetical protein